MRRLWDRIRRRIALSPSIAAAVAALLVVSLLVGVFNDQKSRAETMRAAQVQAEILAGSVAGALAFDDPSTAQEYLYALRANPRVEAAAAYDRSGRLVASLRQAGGPPPARPIVRPPAIEGGRLSVAIPVVQGTTQLGFVYVRFSTEGSLERMTRYLGVAVIIVMAAMLILILGASNARLAEAHRRLQAETAEREKAEDALRQAQKMEAMGQLTGGVAHDFNNLLMVASSGLDLMERTSDPARRERLRDGIRQAIDRGASLTQQLLAFARRAPVKPEVINPRMALSGMLNMMERSLREDVTVRLDVPSDIWLVEVDPSAFEVAVLNMAINARDAMPHGGVVKVHAENVPGGHGEPDMVQVCVTDTGVGLAPEFATRVFEPFFTTKGVGQGTGLGLSQVYGFARSSGGDVEFHSEVGKGTTVCVRLPRAANAPHDAPPVADQMVDGPARCRVLMVEDDEAVAQLVSEMLSELGYVFVRVTNAEAALRTLEHDPAFDALFSDMVMPGEMDGLQLADEVRARRPEMPILLTTGYSSAAASAAAKGVRLLVKPYRIEALAQELAAAIRPAGIFTASDGRP